MGRAYEVRKASIQKTGAARGKIYTTFAKEIYLAAKKGIPDPASNIVLKSIIEKFILIKKEFLKNINKIHWKTAPIIEIKKLLINDELYILSILVIPPKGKSSILLIL